MNDQGEHGYAIKVYRDLQQYALPERAAYFVAVAAAFEGINQEDSAYYYYKKAKELSQKLNQQMDVARTNLKIASLLESQNNLEEDPAYFNEFWTYAQASKNPELMAQGYNYLGRTSYSGPDPEIPMAYFRRASGIFDSIGNRDQAVANLMNVGVVFSGRLKQYDSAIAYYQKALDILQEDGGHFQNTNQYHDLLNNIGNAYRRSKEYQRALAYYQMAETLQVKKYPLKTKKILFGNMELAYYYLGEYEKAYSYLYKFTELQDSIDLVSQNTTISDIQEKYNNEKLRADNLVLEARRVRNRNLLFAAIGLIAVGGGISVLLHKNTTKKRLLAEKEAALRQERMDALLKEQELLSLDAMVAGQEQERQRIANDLHDNLGSSLATLKMHLENLKEANGKGEASDELFANTNRILEDAYQKVRSMAHARNVGLKGSEGLLPAVRQFAAKVSLVNKLEISVEDHGMDGRLENSLEITLFRTIQEMVTNVVKHARASECTLHITHHEENINIMVEDNGVGFHPKSISRKDGMGLYAIEKRVEALGGTLTIDSEPGRGSSIIIDIPLV